ncbi:TlpA family protein disulfide reductase [Flavobacterium ginsenosidimutans]|uniref:TlpA family protein disulfide reductase n=1 Tax=Flavobacterium ginsenosidimutans TaxID=687844 RepID=UPI000DAD733A|nr:TlpA disulfide reductase family protein [Flavobacterium ginsenosidimutans]KAF2333641.1 TlpA family protein disulfide reductase [Flavobacterium ginsenosidimutans]
MKKINLLFLVFIFFASHMSFAQDEAAIEKEILELHKPTKKIRDSIFGLQKAIVSKIEIEKDSIIKNQLILQLDDLENVKDQNDINELKLDFVFAKNHPNSPRALKLIRIHVGRFIGMNFYDTFVEVFENFTPEIKNSEKGLEMAEKLKYFKQSKVGSPAPDFEAKDINSKTISLANFKGKKYILIDFWASWCGPCREELPYIKELYKKYQAQGFEIISVTKDENSDLWKKAIAKEQIEAWKHISILENNSSIDKDYFVNGVPHKVLIDKNGIIIGKWKGSGEINKHDLQKQLKTIFEAE